MKSGILLKVWKRGNKPSLLFHLLFVRRDRDSNPGYHIGTTVFKTAAIDHSATSPVVFNFSFYFSHNNYWFVHDNSDKVIEGYLINYSNYYHLHGGLEAVWGLLFHSVNPQHSHLLSFKLLLNNLFFKLFPL